MYNGLIMQTSSKSLDNLKAKSRADRKCRFRTLWMFIKPVMTGGLRVVPCDFGSLLKPTKNRIYMQTNVLSLPSSNQSLGEIYDFFKVFSDIYLI